MGTIQYCYVGIKMFACKHTIISKISKRVRTVLQCCAAIFVFIHPFYSASAELRLAEWKNYAQLAEQGAICASFSSLMEAQSLLNPDIGTLWKERRKYAGAVIRKATEMELNRVANEAEINALVQSYSEWVLDSLMSKDVNIQENEAETSSSLIGQNKMQNLIDRHCRVMFETGDAQILQLNPQLRYLLNPAHEAKGNKASQQQTAIAAAAPLQPTKTQQAKVPQQQQSQITLNIGQGKSFALTLPSSKPAATSQSEPKSDNAQKAPVKQIRPKTQQETVSDQEKQRPAPKADKIIEASAENDKAEIKPQTQDAAEAPQRQIKVIASPAKTADKPVINVYRSGAENTAQQTSKIVPTLEKRETQENLEIASVTFTPAPQLQRRNRANAIIQLGSFSQQKNAEKALEQLKTDYPELFKNTTLQIKPHHLSTGTIFFRVETSGMDKGQAKKICDILWQARVPCLLKTV